MSDIIRDIQNAVDRANSMGLSDFMFNDPHPIGRHSRTNNNKGCSTCSTKRCTGRNRSTRGTQRRTGRSTCSTQRRTSRNTQRGSCWKRSTSGTQRGSCWKRRSTCTRQRRTSRNRCSSNNCRWLCCNNFRNKRKWCF
ncbi:CotG/ExsB N-terminal domain-containing protein [Peribacillus frigoritolerans]|uniref:CotG/ExsB N-terminal domain-containing protein n=1 Tax=Peribacillus frigoritolerans TaxID=450367 RepID=UPI003D9F1E22